MTECSNCGAGYTPKIPAQKYCNKTPCTKDRENKRRARYKANREKKLEGE